MSGLVFGAIFTVLVAAPAPDDVRQSLDRVLDKSYQTELPSEVRPQTAVDVQEPRSEPSRRQRSRRHQQTGGGGAFGPIASALLWVLMFAVAAILAFWLIQAFGGYAGDPIVESPATEPVDSAEVRREVIDRPLGDAEALAAQGLYDAAIHTLLLRTLEELMRTRPGGLPRSLTSREILARIAMPPAARQALSELVTAVELCHFGSEVPGPAEYAVCREHFDRFARAYTRSAGGDRPVWLDSASQAAAT